MGEEHDKMKRGKWSVDFKMGEEHCTGKVERGEEHCIPEKDVSTKKGFQALVGPLGALHVHSKFVLDCTASTLSAPRSVLIVHCHSLPY